MGFTADWLALREPADMAARDVGLLRQAAESAGSHPVILDLGSGTGSTVRAMAGYLPGTTSWRLLDGDAALLIHAKNTLGEGAECFERDLRDLEALPLDGVTLVTASALLDLVSAGWLSALAARLEVPFYAALSYDGVMRWAPEHAWDAEISDAFNAHQRTDKGFGPAMGPDTAMTSVEIFTDAGFEIETAQSPWKLGPEESALQAELTDGIAHAADEMGLSDAREWGQIRRAGAGHGRCEVGHVDLFAYPGKKA